jgi:hypothetical protein
MKRSTARGGGWAWDHALWRAVLSMYARVLLAFYARTARSHGIQDGQTDTVPMTNASGVASNSTSTCTRWYSTTSSARLGQDSATFSPAVPPSDKDQAQFLATIHVPWGSSSPAASSSPPTRSPRRRPSEPASPGSVQGSVAIGSRAGERDHGHATLARASGTCPCPFSVGGLHSDHSVVTVERGLGCRSISMSTTRSKD